MEMLQFCKTQQHQSSSSSIPAGTPSKGALQPRVKHYRHSRDLHLSAFVSINLPKSTGANLAGKFSFEYPRNTACTQQNNYFKQDAISFSCTIFMLLWCFINNRGKLVNKKGLGFLWTHRLFQSCRTMPKVLFYCASIIAATHPEFQIHLKDMWYRTVMVWTIFVFKDCRVHF